MSGDLIPSFIRCVRSGGTYPPLFFVHGFAGNMERFNNLVRHLDGDGAIYVLEAQHIDSTEPVLTSVEAMAERYLRGILSIQLSGPYYLIGYSFGGLIAFEMAQQLRRQGRDAALVGLIDAGQPIYRKDFGKIFGSPKMIATYLRRIGELLSEREGRSTLLHRIRAELWRLFFGKLLRSKGQVRVSTEQAAKPRTALMLHAATVEAAVHYHPQPYAGRLDIFRVEDRISVDKFDRYLGWKGLADTIEVHDVPGDHVTVGEEPHVTVLGSKLQSAIRTARGALR